MAEPLEVFLKDLVPGAPDRSVVAERREQLTETLDASTFDAGLLFESGSFSHGTAVKGHSDVDYMAWVSSDRPTRPSSALRSLKSAVDGSHWSIVSTRISSPTVQIEFFSAPNFEVVPAYYSHKTGGERVYLIPGPGDDWLQSAPEAHSAYVSDVNDRLNKRVKGLVRLIKAWKYHHSVPVSSFYLEMRTAEYASGESSIYYDIDLRFLMGRIIGGEVRDMNDPLRLVKRIPACSSDANRRAALSMMKEAREHLDLAWEAQEDKDENSYWSHMYSVFGVNFPWPSW